VPLAGYRSMSRILSSLVLTDRDWRLRSTTRGHWLSTGRPAHLAVDFCGGALWLDPSALVVLWRCRLVVGVRAGCRGLGWRMPGGSL